MRATWAGSPSACAALLCLAALAVAAGASAAEDVEPLFESDSTLTATLEAPWSELVRRKDEEIRHPAVLTLADASGRMHRIEATVETRGLTRLRICSFPPLRIRLARGAAAGTEFAGQRSLKMVTHCRASRVYEQYYVQELLAYRIHNLVSRHSFRVRPLAISYRDSASGEVDGPRFAFLIEDLDDVARRNGHRQSRDAEFEAGDFEAVEMTRFMLFQYLIGNTDWEVLSGPREDACCHNVRITVPRDGGRLAAVPYDFDAAGMIDASYAAPHRSLPITSVTERLYRGFCIHNAALPEVRAEFLARREAVLAIVEGEARLGDSRKRATIRYIDAFFDILASDARFAREVSGRCRR